MQETTFHFPHPFYPNTGVNDAHCLLTVNRWVVMATEAPDNTSISITNAAEHLALRVCRQFGIAPERLIWIEHYPPVKHVRDFDTYELVQFRWNGEKFIQARWTPISRAAVDALLASPDVIQTERAWSS